MTSADGAGCRRVLGRRDPRRRERGQLTVLMVGCFLVVAGLCVVVVDSSAAYLQRQSLNSLADGAALAAVDAADLASVYTEGVGADVVIDPAAARVRVRDYLVGVGAFASYPGLSVGVQTDGPDVEVSIRAPLDLPLTPPGWDGTSRVTASAAASADVTR